MSSFSSPRAKVVVIVLVAIGLIAGLHFLLFREAAQAYTGVEGEYNKVYGELQNIGTPKSWDEIYEFQYKTINYEIGFYEMLRDASLAGPQVFRLEEPTPEVAKQNAEKRILLLWDQLKEIERMRDEPGPEYSFLSSDLPWNQDPSWGVLEQLPERVRQADVALSDMVRGLMDTDALMDNIPEESPLWKEQNQKYSSLLYQIGLNLIKRDGYANDPTSETGIDDELGEVPATLYTLNRIDLIKRNVPRSEFGFRTEEEYNSRLYDLFRLDPQDLDVWSDWQQLNSLIDILATAKKHNLTEVQRVETWKPRDLKWPPPELEEKPDAAEANLGMGKGGYGMMGMDPAMMGMDPMMMGMDPMMMGMDPMMMGMDPNMAAGAAAPAEEDESVFGKALPLEITVKGSNSNIISFLYELTHNDKTFEIDAIDLVSLPQEENTIAARFVVKVISYYNDFAHTYTELDEKILALQQQKKQIATKPGARELARQEGFLEKMDEIPDPVATPAPAGADAAMDQSMMGIPGMAP